MCVVEAAEHRLERREGVEEERRLRLTIRDARQELFAPSDPVGCGCRAENGRGSEPYEHVRFLALGARATRVRRCLLPRSLRGAGVAVDPVHPRLETVGMAGADFVTVPPEHRQHPREHGRGIRGRVGRGLEPEGKLLDGHVRVQPLLPGSRGHLLCLREHRLRLRQFARLRQRRRELR